MDPRNQPSLLERIYSWENLLDAYHEAASEKWYRKPTAQSVKKMKARMRYIAKEYEAGLIDFDAVDATMQSYFGLMGHCSTHGLQKWIEKNIIFKRKEMADIELPQEATQWELNQF